MLDHFSENAGQVYDGLLFGLGLLAVYIGAVFTAALIRSLGGAGSAGLTFLGRYLTGWFDYLRGDDRNTVNITLNVVVDNELKFDTLVADRRVWSVWPNAYRRQLIRRAAKRTTRDNPVICFPDGPQLPKSRLGKVYRSSCDNLHRLLATDRIMVNGRHRRVRLMKEDDYRATYSPLISLVGEMGSNEAAIDLALGRPMDEFRFVMALTFEKLSNRRARHLRAMLMWEEALLNLPEECPRVDLEEHRTRFRTLQSIAQQYRNHPERFGVIKIWRPKGLPRDLAAVLPRTFGELAGVCSDDAQQPKPRADKNPVLSAAEPEGF